MPIPSPTDVVLKAAAIYPRFLTQWVEQRAADFFPRRVRIGLTFDKREPKQAIAASARLMANSKSERGWGYTVHREIVRTRDLGTNPIPKSITIDTLDDLLRLTNKVDDFHATTMVASRVRPEFPGLETWLQTNVRSLAEHANSIDGLLAVTRFFLANPWPDCYARQIPVPVDTKFVERHASILRQWLDLLLPPSAVDVTETKFSRRFGLRDGQPHRAIRLLDSTLLPELGLPYEELSLPLRTISALPVRNVVVFVVENDLNLLTLPSFPRAIAIRGEGNAVNRLDRVAWLPNSRIVYWGDLDVEGFQILARLRSRFEHVESLLMERETIDVHHDLLVAGTGQVPPAPSNLTSRERDAFDYCATHNCRLEQEKIPQQYADVTITRLLNT